MANQKVRNGVFWVGMVILLLVLRFGCGLKTSREARRERDERFKDIPGYRDRFGSPSR